MTSEIVFDGLDMVPETKEALVQQIKHRFALQPVKIQVLFGLTAAGH